MDFDQIRVDGSGWKIIDNFLLIGSAEKYDCMSIDQIMVESEM